MQLIGDLMSLLELKDRQEILIEKVKYEILNMTKFREKSSYWVEYKIRRLEDNKMFYLNVELCSKAILYEILEKREVLKKLIKYLKKEKNIKYTEMMKNFDISRGIMQKLK